MPEYTRGKLRFVYRRIGRVTSSEDRVESFSCHPGPNGTRVGANPVLVINPHERVDHIQGEEKRRIVEFAAVSGFNYTFADHIRAMRVNFRFRALTVNLADIPRAWRAVEPCYDSSISVVVESVLIRIDAVPTQDVTLDSVTWPEGDPLATFQFLVPDRYRFIHRKTYNPQCCPLTEGAAIPPPQSQTGAWSASNFVALSPPDNETDIEEIIVTGRRRRMTEDKPVPISPLGPDDLSPPIRLPFSEDRMYPRMEFLPFPGMESQDDEDEPDPVPWLFPYDYRF